MEQNFKFIQGDISENQKIFIGILCSRIRRLNFMKTSILPNLIYRFSERPNKFSKLLLFFPPIIGRWYK